MSLGRAGASGKVDKRFYSSEKLSPWLTISGPVMLSRVILEKPDWRRRVHLACHEGSPHPKDGRLDLDPRGRVQCRAGREYSVQFWAPAEENQSIAN